MSFKYCWHGTNQQNAEKIISEGFRVGTWFAHHLEDALMFGGNFVFKAEFVSDKFHPGDKGDEWQFHIAEAILPKNIVSLVEYTERTLFSRPPTPTPEEK